MNPSRLVPLPASFMTTLASLHRVAEQIVAPARKPDNEIALAATPGGFGTPEFDYAGRCQQVRVEGAELVHRAGDEERRAPLTTLEDARRQLDALVPGGPLSTAPLEVDAAAAIRLGDWYAFGAAVLTQIGGELWRATGFRGAELRYSELLAATDQRAAALDFFTNRKDALA